MSCGIESGMFSVELENVICSRGRSVNTARGARTIVIVAEVRPPRVIPPTSSPLFQNSPIGYPTQHFQRRSERIHM